MVVYAHRRRPRPSNGAENLLAVWIEGPVLPNPRSRLERPCSSGASKVEVRASWADGVHHLGPVFSKA